MCATVYEWGLTDVSQFPVGYQRSLIDKDRSLWTCVDMLSFTDLPQSYQTQQAVQTWVMSLSSWASPAVFNGNVLHFRFLTRRLSVTTLSSTPSAAGALEYFTISSQSWNCHSTVFFSFGLIRRKDLLLLREFLRDCQRRAIFQK